MTNSPRTAVANRKQNPDVNVKLTHLYLHDKYLKKIQLRAGRSKYLSVLYLHNNEIAKIQGLHAAPRLTSLYLQKNRIAKIEGLTKLRYLRRLYLGHNCISVLEGLENMDYLEVVHIEKQDSFTGDALCFDPRTLLKISRTLVEFNISHNRIESITCLAPLKCLRILNVSYNRLADMEEVCGTIRQFVCLKFVTFLGNPIARDHHYQEEIIASTQCLELLDSKSVTQPMRDFMKKLNLERKIRGLRRNSNPMYCVDDIQNSYPVSLQKAASASILRNYKKNQYSEDLTVLNAKKTSFIPWQGLPKSDKTRKMPQLLRNRKNESRTNISAHLYELKI